eukprot:CAMPEP_0170265054 /NCGR_PEP_ID=MMETSP0116_2-20130129/32432_1 /TAXON_ID=400756 /ORGANISM="Durinskia baltica, Strain CSIRO CS-38" /LENGTH=177 /DNA_ID=CAMNT_0010516167 /DNA_START=9 /DNA_END=539 /DNA_ORIENTATION=-
MTNIFIGVMSNSFDFHQEQASVLFVRARASMALEDAMFKEGLHFVTSTLRRLCFCSCRRCPGLPVKTKKPELWVFRRATNDGEEEEATSMTIRTTIKSQTKDLSNKIHKQGDEFNSKLHTIASEIKELQKHLKDEAAKKVAGKADGGGGGSVQADACGESSQQSASACAAGSTGRVA